EYDGCMTLGNSSGVLIGVATRDSSYCYTSYADTKCDDAYKVILYPSVVFDAVED
ncbi:hypothetical protein STEG23_013495, partial [Scotinomys teguina]